MKKALVTGATGYTGANIVKKLVQDGWDVSILVRPNSSFDQIKEVKGSLSIYELDGSLGLVVDAVAQSQPDVVFHIASLVIGEHQTSDVEPLIESNITFGCQLLEAMALNSVTNIVNTSTYWEHYEDKNYSPVNLYAATKKAFQDILQFYVEARGIKAITLKLFDTYGSNDPRPKLLNLLFKIAETGEVLKMSPGEQKIDLVHIDDVVSAYVVAAQRLLDNKVDGHEIYAVSTGKPMSIKDLVKVVEQVTGKKLHVEWGGRAYRDREVMKPYGTLDRLPNWKPIYLNIQL